MVQKKGKKKESHHQYGNIFCTVEKCYEREDNGLVKTLHKLDFG